MSATHFPASVKIFADHPRFAGVRIATYMTRRHTDRVSVCELEIGPGIEIPVHAHEGEIDSIYAVAGAGEAFVNGAWATLTAGDYIFVPAGVPHGIRNTGSTTLRLFIHHSPPIL